MRRVLIHHVSHCLTAPSWGHPSCGSVGQVGGGTFAVLEEWPGSGRTWWTTSSLKQLTGTLHRDTWGGQALTVQTCAGKTYYCLSIRNFTYLKKTQRVDTFIKWKREKPGPGPDWLQIHKKIIGSEKRASKGQRGWVPSEHHCHVLFAHCFFCLWLWQFQQTWPVRTQASSEIPFLQHERLFLSDNLLLLIHITVISRQHRRCSYTSPHPTSPHTGLSGSTWKSAFARTQYEPLKDWIKPTLHRTAV